MAAGSFPGIINPQGSLNGPVQFSDLGSASSSNCFGSGLSCTGVRIFCANCLAATVPCTAGGTGVEAQAINGSWNCNGGVPPNSGTATGDVVGPLTNTAVQTLHLKTVPVVFSQSPYTLPSDVSNVNCDATLGSIIINPAAIATNSGRALTINKIDATTNTCTFNPGSVGDTVNGVSSIALGSKDQLLSVYDGGTDIWRIGHRPGIIVSAKRACTLVSTSWTCDASLGSIGTIVQTATAQNINIINPKPGQIFTLRLGAGTGGFVPTWNLTNILFPSAMTAPPGVFVPISYAGVFENLMFQYDDTLAQWIFLSRSGNQQLGQTFQGGGTNIGDHPGNGGSVAALALPANTETSVFSDNGGFQSAQGNGVQAYYQLQVGVIQVCNFDSIPTLVAFHCIMGFANSHTVQTAPVPLASGQCTEYQVQNAANNSTAPISFTGYNCYVNPGNSAAAFATWNSVYNEEVPYF